MAGEMYAINPITGMEPDGTTWFLHSAIVEAINSLFGVKAEIRPFDQYQGPYIVVGPDVRIGTPSYALAPKHLGVVRLWVNIIDDCLAQVYREDTNTLSEHFPQFGPYAAADAADAALKLLEVNYNGN